MQKNSIWFWTMLEAQIARVQYIKIGFKCDNIKKDRDGYSFNVKR